MELKFKQLSAYLPYELKVLSGDAKEIYTLIGIENNYSEISYSRTIQITGEDHLRRYQQNIKYCKPILRPLEDLFFNLSIENESQKPFEYLEDFSDTEIERMFLDLIENQNTKFILEKIQYAPLSFIQKLLEWHFDIFGLIDAKLAVDINCL